MITLRLSAAVAPYLDAIRLRRAAGWRWSDIRAGLAVECSDASLAQAVRRCKWQAEQLPLPELPRAPDAPEAKPVQVHATETEAETQQHGNSADNYGGFDKPKPKRVFDDDK